MNALRITLVVLGLVIAVYAVASLTGAWLGEPPWWRTTEVPVEVQEVQVRLSEALSRLNAGSADGPSKALSEEEGKDLVKGLMRFSKTMRDTAVARPDGFAYLRPGRVWISAGVAVAGLALAALAAWPRRAEPTPPA